MAEFPPFMQHPMNRIDASSKLDAGMEGYVFDGADGTQMAFWTCTETTISPQEVHDHDEYLVVVEGNYTLMVQGRFVELKTGQEYFIPKGVPHGSKVFAGTRTIHAFGGKRVTRAWSRLAAKTARSE